MTRVVVLTAVDVEARGLARHLGLARVAGATHPHFRAGALELVCVGPGAGHLDARVGGLERPALLVSAAACGALAPHLEEGELVVPEAVLDAAGARHATAEVPGLRRRGTLLGVAAVVRAVSDPASRGVPPDLAALVEPDGRVRTAHAVRVALARPRALADALALRSGTHAALRSVARALARLARAHA